MTDSSLTQRPNPAPPTARPRPRTILCRRNPETLQVRLGHIVPDQRSDPRVNGSFALDPHVLRTSMLIIGPPGSGKTTTVGRPLVEHFGLVSLEEKGSTVVIDPKGEDYTGDGWFDEEIDMLHPRVGFDLYGGSNDPGLAADQLASTILPTGVSADKEFFDHAARNALAFCLEPFHLAYGRLPTIPELLAVLTFDRETIERINTNLKGKPNASQARGLLKRRETQMTRTKQDPAASAIEALTLLDRPVFRNLFEHKGRRFAMSQINQPTRVRVILAEAEYPDASKLFARLVIAQFLTATSSATTTNKEIFKILIFDEAGDKVTEKLTRAIRIVRSYNAGVVLAAQSLHDFPRELWKSIFASTGCKLVFGNGDPDDAEYFSRRFGDRIVPEYTISHSQSEGVSYGPLSRIFGFFSAFFSGNFSKSTNRGVSVKLTTKRRWSESDVINGLNAGECLAVVASYDGRSIGPIRVDLRN